jgi:hypothetical protein
LVQKYVDKKAAEDTNIAERYTIEPDKYGTQKPDKYYCKTFNKGSHDEFRIMIVILICQLYLLIAPKLT